MRNEDRMVDAKVVECLDVTPGLREIRLRGPAFGVVTSKPAAHVPVEIAVDGGHVLRTYSVWAHDRVTASLTLRVVAHDPGGPGSRWAAGVSVGTRLRIGLPRNRITLDPTARYHVFVGEETAAIPLLTMLAALPPTADTFGVLETSGPAAELSVPDGRAVTWVHRGRASAVNSPVLLRAVRALDLPAGPGVAYVAGVQTHWTPGRTGLV